VIERVLLGTAAFSGAYGRRKGCAPLSGQEARAVLNTAWATGIRGFDTAEAYGPAAEMLSTWLAEHRRLGETAIVTKVGIDEIANRDAVARACGRFAGARELLVLSHGVAPGPRFAELRRHAAEHSAAAGQSLYTAVEVTRAAAMGAVRVQAPLNVFDPRQMEAAHAVNVRFDARSVFLQGVLLDEPRLAEQRAPGCGRLASAVSRAAGDAGLSPAAALLAAASCLLRACDRLVIGIDEPSQLAALDAAAAASPAQVRAFMDAVADAVTPGQVPLPALDPRGWRSVAP
jgi:aryl-alcohol dehydrogenase-like predicted oxidoreductase